jgi:hypothetical protein
VRRARSNICDTPPDAISRARTPTRIFALTLRISRRDPSGRKLTFYGSALRARECQRENLSGVSVAQPVNNCPPLCCLLLFRSPARKTISQDNKHGALALAYVHVAICCSAGWNRAAISQTAGYLLRSGAALAALCIVCM